MYKFAFFGLFALLAGTAACSSADSSDSGETSGAVSAQRCGGFAGLTCGEGSYCDYGVNEHCGAADQLGTCKVIPQFCTREFMPVCGCDGETYGNACEANGHGTAVAKTSACEEPKPEKRSCGGHLGLGCNDNEFCNYELKAICGAADQTGTCEAKPQVCFEIYAPVCGCDGKTYGNSCEANREGVAAAREGACEKQ
jgi:hypothetical protein